MLKLKITTMSVCTHPYVHDKKKSLEGLTLKTHCGYLLVVGTRVCFIFPQCFCVAETLLVNKYCFSNQKKNRHLKYKIAKMHNKKK